MTDRKILGLWILGHSATVLYCFRTKLQSVPHTDNYMT